MQCKTLVWRPEIRPKPESRTGPYLLLRKLPKLRPKSYSRYWPLAGNHKLSSGCNKG
jgi:hypothetical protein